MAKYRQYTQCVDVSNFNPQNPYTQAALVGLGVTLPNPTFHNGAPVQIGYKMPYDFAIGEGVFDNPAAEGSTALTSGTADSASAARQPLLGLLKLALENRRNFSSTKSLRFTRIWQGNEWFREPSF